MIAFVKQADEAMKIIAIIVSLILLSFGTLRLLHWRSQKQAESKSAPKATYQGLRNLAFQSSPAKLGIPARSTPTQPWGVVMDWGLAEGTATVVAFSDGNASVYVNSGGGFIGGASHESIRKAAQRMVTICRRVSASNARYDNVPTTSAFSSDFLSVNRCGDFHGECC